VLAIGGTFANAIEQQTVEKAIRIPRQTRMEFAIVFLDETRGESLPAVAVVSSTEASRGRMG